MESNLIETLAVGSETFPFELCRKRETEFGPVTVDHWWMPVTELYAQRQMRNRCDGNHQRLLDCYWAMCREQQATDIREAQERYLLASLLPLMRSQGSRTIFRDAFLDHGTRAERDENVRNLNELLADGRGMELTEASFHEQSWNLLGRAEFPPETQRRYDDIVAGFFDVAYQFLRRDRPQEAQESVRTFWAHLIRRIGRRAGEAQIKLVLDTLSYEARAALHHCYSAVWAQLIPLLAETYQIDRYSIGFLSLWHQDRGTLPRASFNEPTSIFHGHVFGLHPGLANFLKTAEGQGLMGRALRDPDHEYLRLLHGFYISLYDYEERRCRAVDDRRSRVDRYSVADPDETQQQQSQSGFDSDFSAEDEEEDEN